LLAVAPITFTIDAVLLGNFGKNLAAALSRIGNQQNRHLKPHPPSRNDAGRRQQSPKAVPHLFVQEGGGAWQGAVMPFGR
jgi:hypothetical protein